MVQISERKLTDIRPYERNPRKNDSAVKYVANSIREFGFKVPIVIDANGVIVAGHTRYKAAKQLGMKTVPCVVADDLNDEQIAAFRLADNKTAELAEWDADLLTVELDDIAEIDMSDFGFEYDAPEDGETEIVEDEVPEKAESRASRGDIWQLGDHRLMCGDSAMIDDVEKLMGGRKPTWFSPIRLMGSRSATRTPPSTASRRLDAVAKTSRTTRSARRSCMSY